MFVGHIGAGLALKQIDKDLNAGWLVGASLLSDIVLWGLTVAGLELVVIPDDFADKHFLTFQFPYSHSLVATIFGSVMVGTMAYLLVRKHRRLVAGIAVGLSVLLHWVCDWIEHLPDLPMAGAGSPKLGLGLWSRMPLALAVEVAFALIGIFIFFRMTTAISPWKKWGMAALVLVTAILTVYGGLASPPPPGVMPLAVSSLATDLLVIAITLWLDHPRTIR